MRMSKDHINIIKTVTKEIYGDVDVFLFGSRIDDSKKGGDIDLFIEIDEPSSLEKEIKFLTKLERAGIERKVDLVVKSLNSKHRSIFDTAKQTGVKL